MNILCLFIYLLVFDFFIQCFVLFSIQLLYIRFTPMDFNVWMILKTFYRHHYVICKQGQFFIVVVCLRVFYMLFFLLLYCAGQNFQNYLFINLASILWSLFLSQPFQYCLKKLNASNVYNFNFSSSRIFKDTILIYFI